MFFFPLPDPAFGIEIRRGRIKLHHSDLGPSDDLIVRMAFLMMYFVSFVSLSRSQRAQSCVTKSGCVLLTSFSQLPTLSRTYLALSDLSLSNIGRPNSGCCLSTSICSHQTPRGRVASDVNLLIFSSSFDVQPESIAMLSGRFFAILALTAIQQISRTPKCVSAAKGRICCSVWAMSRWSFFPIAYVAQQRTRSAG